MNASSLSFFILCLIGGACAHSKPSPIIEAPLPSWVLEDCVEKEGYYYFLGFGEGSNVASALRHALLVSRQSALNCVFGGSMRMTSSVTESSTNVIYSGQIDTNLSIDSMNWLGFEQVAGKSYVPSSDKGKVYIQYRWSSKFIEAEKFRLKSEKETALQEKQGDSTNNQASNDLSSSNKSFSLDRSLAKIKEMKEKSDQSSRDFYKLIYSLPCRTTVRQFIELYREQDSVELNVHTISGDKHLYLAFFWGRNSVRIYNYTIQRGRPKLPLNVDTFEQFIESAKDVEVKWVYNQVGISSTAGNRCDMR
jgi:hypothetical protein